MVKVYLLFSGNGPHIGLDKCFGDCEAVFASVGAAEQCVQKSSGPIERTISASKYEAVVMWVGANGTFWAVFEEEIHGVD